MKNLLICIVSLYLFAGQVYAQRTVIRHSGEQQGGSSATYPSYKQIFLINGEAKEESEFIKIQFICDLEGNSYIKFPESDSLKLKYIRQERVLNRIYYTYEPFIVSKNRGEEIETISISLTAKSMAEKRSGNSSDEVIVNYKNNLFERIILSK